MSREVFEILHFGKTIHVILCVSDFTEEVVNRKRRSSSLVEEGETTFVAQMTVFDKNR